MGPLEVAWGWGGLLGGSRCHAPALSLAHHRVLWLPASPRGGDERAPKVKVLGRLPEPCVLGTERELGGWGGEGGHNPQLRSLGPPWAWSVQRSHCGPQEDRYSGREDCHHQTGSRLQQT